MSDATRETWLQRAETIVIVTVISVLVWLYAEGENVQTYTDKRVLVKLLPPPGRDLAIRPDTIDVRLNMRASAGEADRLDGIIRNGAVELEVGEEDNGKVLVLREALQDTVIGNIGLNITSTSPDYEQLSVEPLVQRRLPVNVATTSVQFARQPTVEPREVTVTMRESVAGQVGTGSAVADLSGVDFTPFEANTPQTIEVPIALPDAIADDWTEPETATARVTFTVRKTTDTFKPDRLPIRISADPLLLQQYDVEPTELVLQDVTLVGPSDAIERVRRGEERVYAELRPTSEQLEGGVEALTPALVAPPGVSTAQPLPPIPVRVERQL